MRFYSVRHSLDVKVMGHYPQVKEVAYHCSVDNDPLFIDKFPFKKINIEPIVASPILHAKSNPTDLIYLWDQGFSFTKLVSGRLKEILERSRNSGLQFINCPVFKKDIEYNDYWLLNMYEFNNDYLDISNSRIAYHKKSDDYEKTYMTNLEYLSFANFELFNSMKEEAKKRNETFSIDRIALKANIPEDFFSLQNVEGGVKYVVSEKLKKEIEEANCTGIEFMPVGLTLNEWLYNEREKVYGKS